MSLRTWQLVGTLMTAGAGQPVLGQSTGQTPYVSTQDSSFAALQARGEIGMGVDQYASTHHFDNLPDGGRIELQVDSADTTGVRTIRQHLRSLAEAFGKGNFRTPSYVHDGEVPGTRVMTAQREHIKYQFSELPGGGAIHILTANHEALEAVHSFLAFQRQQHHAGGTRLHR